MLEGDLIKDESDAITVLQSLIKTNESKIGDLLKAKKKDKDDDDDDDDDDGYKESFMKKHMKKFMKDNPDYMNKMGSMKKAKDAVDDAYESIEGDLKADATMIEGTEMFKAFKDLSGSFLKAISHFGERLEDLEQIIEDNTNIAAASGEVLIKASETLDKISETPAPVKSQLIGGNSALQKAQTIQVGVTPDELLQKAQAIGISTAKSILLKAAIEGKNQVAGNVLTQVESCGGNFARLEPRSLKTIVDLTSAIEVQGGKVNV